MTNPEKQREVAEWCGMKVLKIPWRDGDPGVYPPHFDDPNSCRIFEQEAQRQDLGTKYAAALLDVVLPGWEEYKYRATYHVWQTLMATPQQRLDAICEVIKEQVQQEEREQDA